MRMHAELMREKEAAKSVEGKRGAIARGSADETRVRSLRRTERKKEQTSWGARARGRPGKAAAAAMCT